MNILMVDIAGTVDEYSAYLSEAVYKKKGGDRFSFMCPTSEAIKDVGYTKLLSLVPAKFKRSEAGWKRVIKAFETLTNYVYIVLYIKYNRVDVVHFQWFPFLQIVNIEKYILKIIIFLSPHIKIFYTHHNVYPHNSSEKLMLIYKKRFMGIEPYIDKIICHTESSKMEIMKEFYVREDKLKVIYHGIFFPREKFYEKKNETGKKRILMYGMQESYKGTDILVKAIDLLPADCKQNIELTIVGRTQETLLKGLKLLVDRNNIIWIPNRISNQELYSYIASSDLLVYPYRKISQSGALLLGLYFGKNIITSDLPSFKETLYNFKDFWFFKSDDVESLRDILESIVNCSSFIDDQTPCLQELKKKYSWDAIAEQTLILYLKQQ